MIESTCLLPLLTLLPFVVLSLIVTVLMIGDYRIARHEEVLKRLRAEEDWASQIPHLQALADLTQSTRRASWLGQLGWAQLRTGDYDGAMASFEESTQLNERTTHDEARMIILFEKGETEQARELMEKVLATKPENAAANYYRARLLMEQGEYLEAGRALRLLVPSKEWNARAEPLRREIA